MQFEGNENLVMLSYHLHSVSSKVLFMFRMDLGKEAIPPLSLNKQTNSCILTIQLYITIISVLALCPAVPLPVSSNHRDERLLLIKTTEGLCFQI